ncbi:S8 family serine peptidase [bacterium]|nr:S8 family serine peptidase [bacterium]
MNRINIFVITLACLSISNLLAGIDTTSIDGYLFEKISGKWYQDWEDEYYPVHKTVIAVRFNDGVDSTTIDSLNSVLNTSIQEHLSNINFYNLLLDPGEDAILVTKDYQSESIVDIAFPHVKGIRCGTPNDDDYGDQWYLEQVSDADIDASSAWDYSTGETNVIVGLFDTGVDIQHEDLIGNIWVNPGEDLLSDGVVWDTSDVNNIDDDDIDEGWPPLWIDDFHGWNFIDNSNNVFDSDGHGTNMAGLIAAMTNNDTGISGVAGGWGATKGVRIMILKGDDWTTTLASAANYFVWKRDSYPAWYPGADARFIFCLPMYYPDGSLLEDFTILDSGGNEEYSLTIVPAGDGDDTEAHAPNGAGFYDNLNVGSTDEYDYDEDYMIFEEDVVFAGVVAPGDTLYTTGIDDTYESLDGTSAAVAIVTGIAALVRSEFPSLTPFEVREVICRTAEDVHSGYYTYSTGATSGPYYYGGGYNNKMGYGRVNAHFAIAPTSAPTNLRVDNWKFEDENPELSWTAPTEPDVTAYKVYSSGSSGGPYTLRVTTVNTYWTDTGYEISRTGSSIYYRVKAEDFTELLSDYSNTASIEVTAVKGVPHAPPPSLPLKYDFAYYPNPFNPTTTINYDLPDPSHVSLVVYAINGNKVITLVDRQQVPGWYQLQWDGTDDNGMLVSAGLYLVRLHAGKYTKTGKLIYLR